MSELDRLPHSAPGLNLAEDDHGSRRHERITRFIKAARAAGAGGWNDGDVAKAAEVMDSTLAEVVHLVIWPDRRARFVFGRKPKPTDFPPETSLFSGARSIVTEILKRTEKRGAR